MSIEVWIDTVSSALQRRQYKVHDFKRSYSNDKENRPPTTVISRKRSLSASDMDVFDADSTPKPPKRRVVEDDRVPIAFSISSKSSYSDTSSAGSLLSHQSGRLSPTKQMQTLRQLDEPVLFESFGTRSHSESAEMTALRGKIRRYTDGIGVISIAATDVEQQARPLLQNYRLDREDLARLTYTWACAVEARTVTGSTPPLARAMALVELAVKLESSQSHETTWNEDVHREVIKLALESSVHSESLVMTNVYVALARLIFSPCRTDDFASKSTRIDPKSLALAALPRRVVDYTISLKPDQQMERAFARLKPLGGTIAKSWNHVTSPDCCEHPFAISIETKAPNKSWTDGKPQLGIWAAAFVRRLGLLAKAQSDTQPEDSKQHLAIPDFPLLVVQGHDWHLLLVSSGANTKRSSTGQGSLPEPNSINFAPGSLTIFSKYDIGSTRSCFELYKLLAVLHLLFDWAETTWRPWFHKLIAGHAMKL